MKFLCELEKLSSNRVQRTRNVQNECKKKAGLKGELCHKSEKEREREREREREKIGQNIREIEEYYGKINVASA